MRFADQAYRRDVMSGLNTEIDLSMTNRPCHTATCQQSPPNQIVSSQLIIAFETRKSSATGGIRTHTVAILSRVPPADWATVAVVKGYL